MLALALSFQDEKEVDFNKGLLTVERHDDVLGKSLPNREHAERVRGIGALVGIKKHMRCARKIGDTLFQSMK